jgi:hypothetical protein
VDGQYQAEGPDGKLGTADDEFDPNNPASHPTGDRSVTYAGAKLWHDADADGIVDGKEDRNGNAIYESNGGDGIPNNRDDETDFLDADTDDDGLSDGFEYNLIADDLNIFQNNGKFYIRPDDPDSDDDGLPDGLELGAQVPIPPMGGNKGTDITKTFSYQLEGMGSPANRLCFIKDLEPRSITDPCAVDTNYNDNDDGEEDPNANGRKDSGETDPGIGFISYRAPLRISGR